MGDLIERLKAQRYVREGRDDRDYVCDLDCDAEDYGARAILRNPDGPEAADHIAALVEDRDRWKSACAQHEIRSETLLDHAENCAARRCEAEDALGLTVIRSDAETILLRRIATLEAQLATAVGALERIEAAKAKEYDPGTYADDHQQGYAVGHDAGVEECAEIAAEALASIKGGS